MNPGMLFMQDGTPGHSYECTQQELQYRNMTVITWPA
jgi:hypothetical protein